MTLVFIVELLIFTAVVTVAVGIMREIERQLDQRRRLGGQAAAGQATSLMAKRASEAPFFRWVQSSTSISDKQERSRLRQALVLAGFDSPNATIWYVILRFSLAIVLPAGYIMMQFLSLKPAAGMPLVLWPIGLCAVGLYVPGRILTHLAASRQTQLEIEFPDALDLMVVCVEAGLSLDA